MYRKIYSHANSIRVLMMMMMGKPFRLSVHNIMYNSRKGVRFVN